MIHQTVLGGKRDARDARDHAYEPTVGRDVRSRIDLRPVDPRKLPSGIGVPSSAREFQVYDQFGLNSCTANAIAGALQFLMIKHKWPRIFVPSRMFIYYNTRAREGTERENAPTAFRDGFKSVATRGFCPETLWPYDSAKLTTRPPRRVHERAVKHRLLRYRRVRRDLDHLRHCLVEGYPFTFGMAAYERFLGKAVMNSGRVPMPRAGERFLGYHSVLAIGYDNRRRAFLARNSFGPIWGDRGHFWLPYDYFKSSKLTYDFWTLRAER